MLRSHLVDPEYLAAQKKKEEEKRKKEQRKKQQQASPFGAPAGFQVRRGTWQHEKVKDTKKWYFSWEIYGALPHPLRHP